MTQLNLAYLVSVFEAVVAGTEQGSYAIVPADAAEVAALVKSKYIKTSKRLHNEGGNVGATLVDGANIADLRVDFEIPDFAQADTAPVSSPEVTYTESAPVAPVAEETAPAAPVFEQAAAPFADTSINTELANAPTFAPAEEFTGIVPMTQTEALQEVAAELPEHIAEYKAGAPVVEGEGVRVIGDDSFDVATVAETKNGEVEIDVGVPFVIKVSAAEKRKKSAKLEHHPFDATADFKLKNPTSMPSFHIAGKAVKDMSNSVRRANDRYEANGSPVTFRVVGVDENDPKGKGIRVYAMFTSEAPEQRRTTRKDKSVEDQAAE